jgi:hypothetical protein
MIVEFPRFYVQQWTYGARREVRRGRSTVAIVAGSAGVGAAIGALAGGGGIAGVQRER